MLLFIFKKNYFRYELYDKLLRFLEIKKIFQKSEKAPSFTNTGLDRFRSLVLNSVNRQVRIKKLEMSLGKSNVFFSLYPECGVSSY